MIVSIERIDQHMFKEFIERMKTIDSFIYAKLKNGNIESTVYLPARDAVKNHSVAIETIFQSDEWPDTDKELKMAFFDATKLIDGIKHFGADPIKGEIEFIENENEIIANRLTIFNDELKINFNCSEPSLGFRDIPEETLNKIFSRDNYDFQFQLDTSNLSRIKNLFTLDKEETFTLEADENSVNVKGKDFNAVVNHEVEGNGEITAYKKYLNLLDKENHLIYLSQSDSKIIFVSEDSNTFLTVSTCKNVE